ncbi:MAG: hypothetical protein ABFE13_19915 [Phycisphaerales bacterium]
MNREGIRGLLCVLCLFLPAVVAAAQSETPSIMTRVQREEDPELGDLIRLALENRKAKGEQALEILRKVTESYAQIKLLDQQIAEIARKAESAKLSEIRGELLLAKVELESKRTRELATLRETAGVIPTLPLEEQPIPTLNTYVSLQIIGERLYVLDGQKPFLEFWAAQRWAFVGLLSEKQTLEYLGGKLKDKEKLPVRIDVYYDSDTEAAGRNLRNKIIAVAKETSSQMATEVRLNRINFTGTGQATFYLRQGKITTFYTHEMQRPDGGPEPLVTGSVKPDDLEQHILWRLTKPKNVPLTFCIEHDQASASLAKQVADTATAVVKRLDIGDLVKVKMVPVEPVPESFFLGRWTGQTRGDIQAMDVRPDGVCQVTMGDRFGRDTTPGAIKAHATVLGRWFLTTNEIMVDIRDKNEWGTDHVYRGNPGDEGSLILDRGVLYPQGSWHDQGGPSMTLKKVK